MLLELHVKDIALIREATVEFKNGLNIMTGETGAGKSVIIGSCMLALGGKARPDIVRDGAESAYVELVFSVEKESESYFRDLGIDPEDGIIVMSRKIASGRSVSRINGESVSLKTLRDAAARLIDIYGQNEYHTLMDTENHLAILDAFLGSSVAAEKADVKAAYDRYCNAEKFWHPLIWRRKKRPARSNLRNMRSQRSKRPGWSPERKRNWLRSTKNSTIPEIS